MGFADTNVQLFVVFIIPFRSDLFGERVEVKEVCLFGIEVLAKVRSP